MQRFHEQTVLGFFQENFEQMDFRGHGGVRLRAVCQRRQKDSAVLLILGGRTEFAEKYAEVIHDLRKLDMSIFTFDHRGQGLSQRLLDDGNKGHVDRFDDYVEDLRIFLEEVVGGDRKVFVLAHSMGGAIALRFQRKYPEYLEALVLSSPMLGINCLPLTQNFTRTLSRRAVLDGRGADYIIGGHPYRQMRFDRNVLTSSPVRFDINHELCRRDPAFSLGSPTNSWLYESLSACAAIAAEAESITLPVLLLQSGSDRVVTAPAQRRFSLRAPACRLHTFIGARHELLMEKDSLREPALRRIREFFADLGVAAGKNGNDVQQKQPRTAGHINSARDSPGG